MTDPVRVEKHGVTVTKTVDTDADDARVTLTIESAWSESITVRVREPATPGGTVGIPGDQREHWNGSDDELTFERVVEPGATVRTEYEVAVDDSDPTVDALRTPPEVDVASAQAETTESRPQIRGESVSTFSGPGPRGTGGPSIDQGAAVDATPAGDAADGTTRSGPSEPAGPDARRLLESLDGFSMPEDDDEETAAVVNEELGADDLDGSAAGQSRDADSPPESSESDDGSPSGEDSNRKIERTAEAFGGDDIASPADVQARIQRVDDAFPNEQSEQPSPSLEARVRYLQSRFQDLAAYIDAMEAFLDEHGDGEHVLTALSTDMERVQDRLDRLDDEQSAVETKLEAIDGRVDALDEREATVTTEVEGIAESLDAMADVQKSLREDVEALKAFKETLQNAI